MSPITMYSLRVPSAMRFFGGVVSDGAIHGVLGAWAVLPNLEPRLHHSLKIARKNHITEDMNVTVATDSQGQPILILGSGYGFTGIDPENIATEQLDIIYQGIEDTARHFFPAAYNQAQADGSLKAQRRYCIRPWTATGLGFSRVCRQHKTVCSSSLAVTTPVVLHKPPPSP